MNDVTKKNYFFHLTLLVFGCILFCGLYLPLNVNRDLI